MSSNGRRQFVTGEIVQRYSQQIAMASMADVILLGHEQVGSFALSSDKSRLLTIGLQAQVNEIASVLNKHALPRLFALNGIDQQNTQIVAGEIAQVDITALAEMIYKLSLAGMPLFPSDALSAHVRALADLPDADGTENLVTSQMSTVGTLEAAEDAAENPAPVVNPVMEKLADAAVVKLLQPQGVRINRDENGMIDGWEAV
jgi:uncharacterized protein YejL (UPF0352 family)